MFSIFAFGRNKMKTKNFAAAVLVAITAVTAASPVRAQDPAPVEPAPYDETSMARLSIYTVGQVRQINIGSETLQGDGPHTVVLTELQKPVPLTIDGSEWSVWLQPGDHKIVVTQVVEGYPRAQSDTLNVLNRSESEVTGSHSTGIATFVQIVVAECWFARATATGVAGEWNWARTDKEFGGCRMLPDWETYDQPGAMWSVRYGADFHGANSMDLSHQAQQCVARGQHLKSWLSDHIQNADVYVERTGSLSMRKAEAYVTVSQQTATAPPPAEMPEPDPCVSAFDAYHPDGDWDGDGDHDREDCRPANVCPEIFDENHPDGDWDGDGNHDREDCDRYFMSLTASHSPAARRTPRIDLLLVTTVGTYGACIGGGIGIDIPINPRFWLKVLIDLGGTTDLSSASEDGEPTQLQGFQSGPLDRFYLGGGVDLLRDMLKRDWFRLRWSIAGLHLHTLRWDENFASTAFILGARTGVDLHTPWFAGPTVGLMLEGGFMRADVSDGESAWGEEGPGTMSSAYVMGVLQIGLRFIPDGTRKKPRKAR
jgi:hypothetical protein